MLQASAIPHRSASRRIRRSEAGFTLVEVLTVVSIAALLMTAGAPAMLDAMRRGAFNQHCAAVGDIAAQARELALRHAAADANPTEAAHYGVVIVPRTATAEGYVTLVYGTSLEDEWPTGLSRNRWPIPRNLTVVVAYDDAGQTRETLTERLGWFYAFGTGEPIATPTQQRPVPIGTPAQAAHSGDITVNGSGVVSTLRRLASPAVAASPVCSYLGFTNGSRAGSLAIYAGGMQSLTLVEPD